MIRGLGLLSGIVLALTIPLSASTIGTFSMSGTVTVTDTTISWNSDLGPSFAPEMFTLTAGAGIYAGEDGQNSVANLDETVEPVGPIFGPVPFITFNVASGVPGLELNHIFPGIDGTAGCADSPPAPGQLCTPSVPGFTSPFNFQNTSNGGSSASWVFSGVTTDGLAWSGQFTSQFTVPFQTVLAAFAPGGSGSVTNSYSAAEITVSGAVPEPSSVSMLGIGAGLLLLSISLKKYQRS
jgi:hypothetical protein